MGTYKVEENEFSISLTNKTTAEKIVYKAKITKLTDEEFQTKDEKNEVSMFKKEKPEEGKQKPE